MKWILYLLGTTLFLLAGLIMGHYGMPWWAGGTVSTLCVLGTFILHLTQRYYRKDRE